MNMDNMQDELQHPMSNGENIIFSVNVFPFFNINVNDKS